jgi:hypothetical protein
LKEDDDFVIIGQKIKTDVVNNQKYLAKYFADKNDFSIFF